ncbi:15-hydroxyprostaglandin dehydrogenase [NAD(+)] [Cyphellophora attinorum]|uniref:15-hydroxyprostaglandin dehydrogenase [NAD(+)] n=1 Tax=Cyphellophora attinorum TaxID=1664694 RepID=A0A0N0NMI9_9EURO|nr:15-hydroxyprostaglandin dehydrogenase [NAD(+)] [Phialophora attinorum]KPI40408.1 15-hydroxyprostaglandin dehydrogenase [NAD(+)] [Phialophora attinorum]
MAKVALITGGSSGIGLALAKHLVARGWDIVLADLQPPKASDDLPKDRTLYISTDVASFESQARIRPRRYIRLNRPLQPSPEARHVTFDVDLFGVYYGIKLYAHYAARNPTPGGKIIITSSAAGFYPNPAIPQYAAAKHALIGLVRSLAPHSARHNITINTVAPTFVNTNIEPKEVKGAISAEHQTPMSVIIQGFDELMDEEKGHNGAAVEGCQDGLYYRQPIEVVSPSAKRLREAGDMQKWVELYVQRNVERMRRSQKAR